MIQIEIIAMSTIENTYIMIYNHSTTYMNANWNVLQRVTIENVSIEYKLECIANITSFNHVHD